MKHERAAVAAVILAALLLSSLPYLIGYLSQPADRQFMGLVSSVPDWSQYLAWMRGFASRVLIENVLTCEPQSPAFFNLQWLVLGQLSNFLPPMLVLQGFRLLTAAFFLWLTRRISAEYFRDDRDTAAAWGAWLLINFSAGLGWFWVLEKRLSGLQDARFPMDIYVYEPVSFQNMLVFPHFLLAAALLLVIFRLAVAAIEEKRMGRAWLAALLALVLGLTHAYDLIIVYAVLGVFVACLFRRDGFSWRPLLVAGVIGAVSAPPPAYFVYLTKSDPLWRQVLAQFGNAGVFTPRPAHLLVLVGLPLLLTVATWRNVFPRQWPSGWHLMVRVWAVVNFPLLYIPADYQIHMLSGWQIPLGLLAAEGVFRFAADHRPALSRWSLVLLLFALSVPTNVYLLAWRVLEVLKLEHTHYLYRDEVAALAWLDDHAEDSDVVLGSLVVSEYVPFLSGNKVYLGHWAQTVRYEDKRAAVARFFAGDTPEQERMAILGRCNVRYVLHGRAERDLGDFDPSQASYLSLAYQSGETSVFRVDEKALSAVAAADASAVAANAQEEADLAQRTELARQQISPAWSKAVPLSDPDTSGWFPDITADPTGGVHVFWSGGASQTDLVVYCVVGAGGCVEQTVAASRSGRDGNYATRPSATVDEKGMLHLLWRAKYEIAYQKLFLPDPIDGWTQARHLGEGLYTRITADAGGVLHAAWTQPKFRQEQEDDPCRGCSNVIYDRSEDGGEVWSESVELLDTPQGSEKPVFAAGPTGELYIAWEEGGDFYAGKGVPAPSIVMASFDGGHSWQAPFEFSPADFPVYPAIAVPDDGTVVAVWRSLTREGVFYQRSTDRAATWSDPVQLPGLLRRFSSPDDLDGMAVATDAAGNVHLVATGRIGEDSRVNAVYHLVWDGQSWSEPETIFVTAGAAEWPRIAIANGNELHVVWFERNQGDVWNSDSGKYRVWYSRSRSDAPAIAPVRWALPEHPLVRPQTLSRLAQVIAAIVIVSGVILWARRRGL